MSATGAEAIAKDIEAHLMSQSSVYENPEIQETEDGEPHTIFVGLDDRYFAIKIEEF